MATGFSHGLPALRPPGMTWGPGLAAAGVGEEAVGVPGSGEGCLADISPFLSMSRGSDKEVLVGKE